MAVTLPNYPAPNSPGVVDLRSADLGTVVSQLLPYIYVLAGLSMLVMLVWGGITLMTASGDQAKTQQGYGKITAGLIGFGLVFISYFLVQIVEVVLGVKIF